MRPFAVLFTTMALVAAGCGGGDDPSGAPDAGDEDAGDACEPVGCGDRCGPVDDGCGAPLQCGTCPAPATWRVVQSGGGLGALFDVWGSGPNDVWAVGGWNMIARWNGVQWQTYSDPSATGYESVTGTGPSDVLVAGAGGVIRWFNGQQWGTLDHPTSGRILDLWAATDGTIWTVGEYGFGDARYFNGTDWMLSDTYTNPPGDGDLVALWGTGPSNLWAAGDRIVRWNGSAWSLSSDFAATDLWGASAGDVYAVGAYYQIEHWNGSSWSTEDVPATGFGALRGVWGRASNDVWAVGDEGTIVHWDGVRWTAMASGTTATLHAVWGSGPSDVWAVGAGGVIVHYAP